MDNNSACVDTSPERANRDQLQAAIRHRAEEIYEQRGRVPGHEVEDWLQAEQEVKSELAAPTRPAYLSVKVEGVTYVAEYDLARGHGYRPGEFRPGDPIKVRIDQDKLFVMRPNGVELEARIVKSSRA